MIELAVKFSDVPFNTTFHCVPDVNPVSLNVTLYEPDTKGAAETPELPEFCDWPRKSMLDDKISIIDIRITSVIFIVFFLYIIL